VASLLAKPVLVDLRNIYPEEEAARAGLAYYGVGRAMGPNGNKSLRRRSTDQ
jgi:UDPglucose 6-dehydrogenase